MTTPPVGTVREDARVHAAPALWFAYAVIAVTFALVTSEDAHRAWAFAAAPAYVLAWAMTGVPRLRSWAAIVGVVGAVVFPTLLLIGLGLSQPEVLVVREGARSWLDSGSPYLDRPDQLDDFRPYLPFVFVFGALPGVLGDIRLAGLVLLMAALSATHRAFGAFVPVPASVGQESLRPARGNWWVLSDERLHLLLACPVVALALTTSGIDIPQAALTLWAIALLGLGRRFGGGLLAGLTVAMKPTGLFAVVVLALWAWRRGDARSAWTFLAGAVASAALFVVPVLVRDGAALWMNVVAFPAGRASVESPAESPLPGVLLRQAGAPEWLSGVLVVVCGLVFLAMCRRQLGSELTSMAAWVAIGFSLAFAVAPYSRVGYFVLPALVYFPVLFADREGRMAAEVRSGGGPVGRPGA